MRRRAELFSLDPLALIKEPLRYGVEGELRLFPHLLALPLRIQAPRNVAEYDGRQVGRLFEGDGRRATGDLVALRLAAAVAILHYPPAGAVGVHAQPEPSHGRVPVE